MTGPELDTICAVATPPGVGSIAVVRVSGPQTVAVLKKLLPGTDPSSQRSRTVRLGWVQDRRGSKVDHVMVTLFRSPRSYTGEDLAEISCHGGRLVSETVVRLLKQNGCRIAEPGEFTRRAVLAGKLTLSQAEAVLDLVNAQTPVALRNALDRYQGGLSKLVSGLAEELRGIVTEAEYHLSCDEGESLRPTGLRTRSLKFIRRLQKVITTARQNRYLFDHAQVAIIGRPNVGKSSLFNRLVGQERAVVAAQPGTTRDRVDATATLGSVPVLFQDTGGMTTRLPGTVDRQVAAQTRLAVEHADLLLAVFDGSETARPADRQVAETAWSRRALIVVNKTDKPRRLARSFPDGSRAGTALGPQNGRRTIEVSARTGHNVARLRNAVARCLRPFRFGPAAGEHHIELLERCRDAVVRSQHAPDAEATAFELRDALDALSLIDAPTTNSDLLDRVFSRFCVGK